MKLSEAKQFLPLIQAAAEGRPIQARGGGKWHDANEYSDFSFSKPVSEYRIKPELKWRAWRPEEVPVGALLKWPNQKNPGRGSYLITESDSEEIFFGHNYHCTAQKMIDENGEYSTDGGLTWKKCGILEATP